MTDPRTTADDTAQGPPPESEKRAGKKGELAPQYPNVEAWVRDYFLPTFPRPAGELGAAGRWRWCEQWWRHDEAVTILTALWYGWEHAAVQTLGMLDWLPRLYYLLPILAGDDGPCRLCSPAVGDLPARHDMPRSPRSFRLRRVGGTGGAPTPPTSSCPVPRGW